MLKFSKNQKYIFLKANKECDGIFENISFVEMKSSKLILIILKTALELWKDLNSRFSRGS
jgi:hypothetical protein